MHNEKNLQQLFNEYIKECQYSSRLSIETIRGYKIVFRLFTSIMPEITTVKFLTPEMLTEYFMRIQTRERTVGSGIIKTGIKNSTIRTYGCKLNTFFEWLVKNKIIIENPVKRIKLPELIYEDQRALDETDVRKLYSTVTLYSKNSLILRRDTVMISLLLFCGLRWRIRG